MTIDAAAQHLITEIDKHDPGAPCRVSIERGACGRVTYSASGSIGPRSRAATLMNTVDEAVSEVLKLLQRSDTGNR